MGQKIINVSIALTGASVAMSVIALLLPMHKVWFFAGGTFPAFNIKTFVLSVDMESCQSTIMPSAFCDKLGGSPDLEDFAQRVCAPVVEKVFSNICTGFYNAHMLGVMLVVVVVLNAVLQGGSVYALHYYTTASTRKKYRSLSMILQAIGAFFVFMVLTSYFGVVLVQLTSIEARGVMKALISPSRASGVSYGYIILWLSVLVQVAAIILSNWLKTTGEDWVEEERERAKFAAEMGMGDVEMHSTGQPGAQYAMQQGMQPGMYGAQPQFGGQTQPGPAYGQGAYGVPGYQQTGFGIGGFH